MKKHWTRCPTCNKKQHAKTHPGRTNCFQCGQRESKKNVKAGKN